jgi:site-specific DNA-methyltransferase (adenine-specific)
MEPSLVHGEAALFHADCFDWLAAAPARSVHAVVSDPPFGLREYADGADGAADGVWRTPPAPDGHRRSPVPRFTTLSAVELHAVERHFTELGVLLRRALVPGAHVLVASHPLVSHHAATGFDRAGLERRGEVVRLVMTLRGGDRPKGAEEEFPGVSAMARSSWEPWLLYRAPLEGTVADCLRKWGTGGLRRLADGGPFKDVIVSHPTRAAERRLAPHPSLKPQAFLRQVVRAVLPLGEGVVLDPFAGSGSTLAAAEALGYRSIGIELDPAYVELARTAVPRLAELP